MEENNKTGKVVSSTVTDIESKEEQLTLDETLASAEVNTPVSQDKWTVDEILKELNIENTNISKYSNKDIQLSSVINAKKVRALTKGLDTPIEKSIEPEEIIAHTSTEVDEFKKTIINHSENTINEFMALKEHRQQKVHDFELTDSINKTARFNKITGTDIASSIKEEVSEDTLVASDIPKNDQQTGQKENEETENAQDVKKDKSELSNKPEAVNFLLTLQNFFSGQSMVTLGQGSQGIFAKLVGSLSFSKIKLYGMGIILVVQLIFSLFNVSVVGVRIHNFVLPTSGYLVMHTLLLLLGFVLSFEIITNSINTLTKKIMSADLYLSGIVVLNMLLNISMFFTDDDTIIAVGLCVTTMSLILLTVHALGHFLNMKRAVSNFKNITQWEQPHIICDVEDDFINKNIHTNLHLADRRFYKNVPCSMLNKFMENSFNTNFADSLMLKSYAILAGASVVLGVAAVIFTKDIYIGFITLVGFLGITFPISTKLADVFPLYTICKELNEDNGVIEGVNTIEDLGHSKTMTFYADSLFPEGTVQLVGIKTFSGRRIDEVIIDTASVLCETRSVLAGLFINIIDHKKEILKPVDTIVYEDGMGTSAWVDNSKILIGNRRLMDSHNVVIPNIDFETPHTKAGNDVIYVATAGVISAMFIVKLTADNQIINVLHKLYHANAQAVIKTVDYMVTDKFLTNLFGVPEEFIAILPTRLHNTFNNEFVKKPYADGKLCNDGSLKAYAQTFISIHKLMNALNTSKVIFYVNMIVSAIAFVIMGITSTLGIINIWVVLLYSLLWLAVSFVLSKRIK